MFKVGDKVICINNDRGYFNLTIGKEYVVLESNGEVVELYDNTNFRGTFYNHRFKLKESTVEFQVGDIVEFGGLEGVITDINFPTMIESYPIRVSFEGEIRYFTKDGKYSVSHTKPLLNLVSRPKKKEKRLVKTTVQYSPSLGKVLRDSEGSNDSISVELEKEIEVEV